MNYKQCCDYVEACAEDCFINNKKKQGENIQFNNITI